MLISRWFRDPAPDEPVILAAFSFRYDAHLVPGLLENLSPAVHGYVAWDDRAAGAALGNEPARRNALLAEARRMGAEWILAADPDERFEDRLAERLPAMIAMGPDMVWNFDFREMFSPLTYRTDGLWGGKVQMRFFALSAAQGDLTEALHGAWIADMTGLRRAQARLNIYHMRMASPLRRRMRRALYAAADPGRRFQSVGYDYLDDEGGMVLDTIPEGRGYSPPFEDDGGLWAPDPGDVGDPVPDPFEPRLEFAGRSVLLPRGQGAALTALRDLSAASPADADLAHAAARTALRAGLPEQALTLTEPLLDKAPRDLHAHLIRAMATARLGGDAADSRAVLAEGLGNSPLLAALTPTDFTATDARWRRWTGPDGRIHEGARMTRRAEMTVIIPGFRAQAGIAPAVASLVEQDEAAEIVVVNTGGGDLRGLLAPWLDHIRLIEVEGPHYVGLARNIGVDASTAPWVSFLAGDCRALPGWVSGRMRQQRAGAGMVSTPVVAEDGQDLTGIAAHLLRYAVRHPDTPDQDRSHFGRSYARWILEEAGIFPPGLRVSEDEQLNRASDRYARTIWAPDVLTTHRDPADLRSLLADERIRGQRRADHVPYRALAGQPDAAEQMAAMMGRKLDYGQAFAARHGDFGPRTLSAVQAVQWLASQADRAGVAEAYARLTPADADLAEAEALRETDPAAALPLAERAWQADPQDWRKATLLGRLRLATGTGGGEEALRLAADIAPRQALPVVLLAEALAATDPTAALHLAEEAITRAPGERRLWDLASDLALRQGDVARGVAWRRAALALAPQSRYAHRRLALVHRAAGDALALAFRDLAFKRLTAWEEARKAAAP